MIAPEGKIILVPVVLLLVAGILLLYFFQIPTLKLVNIGLILFATFCFYFFRDPVRISTGNNNQFVSPADGKIVQIKEIEDTDFGKAQQISIFLSVFNVHRQRVPLSATVIYSKYNKGKYLAAFNHKASLDNEQTEILFDSGKGKKYKIKQIAGLIARRIINYMKPKMEVERGDNLGFIRFGSRVDILVPLNFKIGVTLGQKVIGGETIIGEF
ncbi:MAG: phosphatidylserine decarboxylase family protein [Candidatus Marinimicrobia bacterium]|nr:phosphatidylserine decarboxylase family protein [Candidatus Neomarinimicrobiota bacterium]MBL7022908.1 phosphatidylserine decarboxylase family protein [Candidatus Neomarinimicrobiota bacterium]MBL7109227.1 phosphatidylserine decarboxylase family protein [Candidatus Neomarinimicrobiota bacterium]